MSLSSLASWVSVVSGSWWNREPLASFSPSCLYFTCTKTAEQRENWPSSELCIYQLLLEELDKKNQGLKVWRRSVWILNNLLINQNEYVFPLSHNNRHTDWTWTHHAASVLTWLCSCDASLACRVSRVSGSFEYRELDASFFPASLYLV